MGRQFDATPQHHIFYDMGAGSTVASVVRFENIVEKDGFKWTKNVTQLQVLSVGWDRTLGGVAFDSLLQQRLVALFKNSAGKKTKSDVLQNQQAMARLLREANRVKHILSANLDTTASVEGLFEEIDFRATVTRDDFEALSSDLLDRVTLPIFSALKSANITLVGFHRVISHLFRMTSSRLFWLEVGFVFLRCKNVCKTQSARTRLQST